MGNLQENANLIKELGGIEEGDHHLKMMSLLRLQRVTVMRVSKTLGGKVHIYAKIVVDLLHQPVIQEEKMKYALLLGLFGRFHTLKVKRARTSMKPRRKSP